ncbi:MAG: DUF1573 domain-containing protein [Bacteroidaceae bacterium]
MKTIRRTVMVAVMALATLSVGAQTQKPKVTTTEVKASVTTRAENYAEIKFDTLRHDFGKFSKEDPIVKCSFGFTNTGTAPLIIHQAFATCGCTVPTWPRKPIKPGERGVIEVTYNGTDKFPGHFQKTVTIRTNGITEVVRLTIEGLME